MNRECTKQILEMVDEDLLDVKYVLTCALVYMGEEEVRRMCKRYNLKWESSNPDSDDDEDNG